MDGPISPLGIAGGMDERFRARAASFAGLVAGSSLLVISSLQNSGGQIAERLKAPKVNCTDNRRTGCFGQFCSDLRPQLLIIRFVLSVAEGAVIPPFLAD